jgi:hypothetical protein
MRYRRHLPGRAPNFWSPRPIWTMHQKGRAPSTCCFTPVWRWPLFRGGMHHVPVSAAPPRSGRPCWCCVCYARMVYARS